MNLLTNELRSAPGDKIVILISVFERGGAERQAYLLAREWRRDGINAEVWALTHSGSYAAEFEAAGIPIRVLGFHPPDYRRLRLHQVPILMRRLWRVARQLRQAHVDVLLPFTTWPNVVAGLIYRFAGVRLCIWGERHCGGERVARLERLAAAQYPRFVANSTAGVEFLQREMRVAAERISFVPNGVEEPGVKTAADWRVRLGLQPGQLLVVKVANLSSHKDHPTLLRAWNLVQTAWPNMPRPFLALAGHHGSLFEECRRIVRDTGLESTIGFLGSVPDVGSLIAAADLTVFSSQTEGMPNGVLECMAAGKAIVATDLPGIRDVLGPGADGVLVPARDPPVLARALLALLRDGARRDALGRANRLRASSEFSVTRMAERHLQILRHSLPVVPTRDATPLARQSSQQRAQRGY